MQELSCRPTGSTNDTWTLFIRKIPSRVLSRGEADTRAVSSRVTRVSNPGYLHAVIDPSNTRSPLVHASASRNRRRGKRSESHGQSSSKVDVKPNRTPLSLDRHRLFKCSSDLGGSWTIPILPRASITTMPQRGKQVFPTRSFQLSLMKFLKGSPKRQNILKHRLFQRRA